jgi:anti-anti-sigma regulatory factor
MDLTLTENSETLVTLHIKGKLDGSNYETLIDEAQKLYDSGRRNLLLDMSELTFISSAGISALHRAALIFRGEKRAGHEEGWASYRAIDRDRGSGKQEHIKLFGLSERVQQTLETVGFTELFEIFTDLDAAIASFG